MNTKLNIKNFNNKVDLFPLILIVLMIFSRLIPHPPNFTPLISVAVLSGILFKNFYLSMFVLICSMFLSDFIIGFHKSMFLIYLILIFIGSVFFRLRNKINYKNLFGFSLIGALLFYILTNFVVWLNSGIYEQNLGGLLECYILAIPFFSNTLFSTLLYSYSSFTLIKNFQSDKDFKAYSKN